MYGALTLTPIPPGAMSVFTYIGLKDLARGTLSAEAQKTPAAFAFILAHLGLREFTATKASALLSMAALPLAGGLFGYLASRSRLVGGASALLLSLVPLSYLSAIGGDYTFVAAMVLVQFCLVCSLLSIRGQRRLLVPVWVALSTACGVLVGLDVASAAWLLFGTSFVWGVYALSKRELVSGVAAFIPGAAAAVAEVLGPADPTEPLRLVSPMTALSQYEALLGVLGFAGAAGAVALVYRKRREAFPLVSFVATGLALVPAFGAEAFILVVPGVAALAMVPLLEVRGMVAVVRERSEQVTLEVHFEKAVALSFALIMLASPLVTGLGPGTAIQGSNYLGNEELSAISQVSTLSPSVFGGGLVGAPASIAPWLRAELGVDTVLALTPQEAAVADAITSTSFRLRSPYLMVDDWTPFSSVRSPFIYAFDGSTYGAVLHLDDGTNMVNLTSKGAPESMGGMYLAGHSYTQGGSNMSLTMRLSSVGFNVTKQITLATGKPVVTISYDVTPNHAAPTAVTLSVYVEGVQKISESVSGDAIALSMPNANITMAFPGGSTPVLVDGPTQSYVESTFAAKGGSVQAAVTVDVTSAKSSGEAPLFASLLDAVRSEGVTSLLTFAPQPGLDYLGYTGGEAMSLDVKDAFDRVLYNYNGSERVESATNARVLSQSVSNSSCAASFNYETTLLDIQKQVSATNDSVSLSYVVQPLRPGATLQQMNMTFWIPYGRALLGYSASGGSVTLRLDSGDVTITPASGTVTSVQVGPDPTYGQLRAVLTFSLSGTLGRAGATMDFGKQVSCQEVLASRPIQSGTDELQLSVPFAPILQVYSNQYFAVYKVNAGELPP